MLARQQGRIKLKICRLSESVPSGSRSCSKVTAKQHQYVSESDPSHHDFWLLSNMRQQGIAPKLQLSSLKICGAQCQKSLPEFISGSPATSSRQLKSYELVTITRAYAATVKHPPENLPKLPHRSWNCCSRSSIASAATQGLSSLGLSATSGGFSVAGPRLHRRRIIKRPRSGSFGRKDRSYLRSQCDGKLWQWKT